VFKVKSPVVATVIVGIVTAALVVAVPVIVDATAAIAPLKVAVPVVTFIALTVAVVPIAELNVTPPEVLEAFTVPLLLALPFTTPVTVWADDPLKAKVAEAAPGVRVIAPVLKFPPTFKVEVPAASTASAVTPKVPSVVKFPVTFTV
jgi:hypothetical protein